MSVDLSSAALDVNTPIVEEHPDGLKSTSYFEDYLFNLFQDIGNINDTAGRVLALELISNIFTLTQSTGTSPLTVDLTSLDGRVLTIEFDSATDTITLTQSTGISPITVDLSTFNIARNYQEQMDDRFFVSSDFTDPVDDFRAEGIQGVEAGPGSSITVPGSSYDFTNHPGVWALNTGNTAAGRVFLFSKFPRTLHVGVGGITRCVAYYQSPDTLSDGAQRYVLRAGFFSVSLPNTVNEGIGFEYQDDQNGGRWQGICGDAPGVETSLDTGITVAVDTYYKLEFEVNAAGTLVEFFIDNVSVGTIDTNIPAGTGFGLFWNIHIMKLVGNTSRAAFIDAYSIRQEISR